MKYADLHVHTYYSDSTFSPEEVISLAEEKGLAAIAICNHDSVDGIAPCREAGVAKGIEVIPSIELTVEKPDAEIHILGYFIDWKKEWFLKKLKHLRAVRIERLRKMVEKLEDAGVKVDAADILKSAGKGSVGRLHLARAMMETGKMKSFKEIFGKYIGFQKPCYVSNVRFTPEEAIGDILKLGGVPVLAHPDVMGRDEYIPELVEHGLRGIEVYHTDHGSKATKHYEEMAMRLGLLVTGGSDCHGLGKGRALLGTVRVPYELVEKLKAESRKLKADS